MSATALTKDTFQNHIKSGVTLVDFWAPWCGPCRVQLPIVEELANELKDQANIAIVNVDDEQELAIQFGVRSIPTLLLFNEGKLVEQMVGINPKSVLKDKILNAAGK
ncbi:thioredoxin [Paenibacillus sp. FSL F4-0122]|uniref:thioredoxin n=1 Tax=Paenibacillus TaxID=44249 RepID=UPI00096ECE6A|nr:thioredoxin [Paenibacillus odorifer]OME44207.1 thioredoxin [Paenibacillus odorifer]OZQ77359.1 thioredoxin [Paenibacillus odorifer]